ncbi:MAG: hypothetical protein LC799_19775, partial [Actinobacteria bacterium]|nr:hypothetical protein [Actinomycetota bacterium]
GYAAAHLAVQDAEHLSPLRAGFRIHQPLGPADPEEERLLDPEAPVTDQHRDRVVVAQLRHPRTLHLHLGHESALQHGTAPAELRRETVP